MQDFDPQSVIPTAPWNKQKYVQKEPYFTEEYPKFDPRTVEIKEKEKTKPQKSATDQKGDQTQQTSLEK